LNKIRGREDGLLNSYGWVDEKAGTVRIPIERAMDLLVQRGLPVRPQDAASNARPRKRKQPTKSARTEPARRVKRSELRSKP